ncbi:MAG: HPr family phosphocarrier protein [Gammaproteobacteria bacterium]|nr:MAG: HPr family phosphocarrier protein [Gammaproteobacteria bacterium]
MLEREIVIPNKLGLHARAAAKLVNVAGSHASEVTLSKDGQEVNGKSIMGVMMLAASKGTTIRIRTQGPDEQATMNDLLTLIENRFGESE